MMTEAMQKQIEPVKAMIRKGTQVWT